MNRNRFVITLLSIVQAIFFIVPCYAQALEENDEDAFEFEVSKADVKAKTERVRSALIIAQEYARMALLNPLYIRIPRSSIVPGGPADIRQVLQRFLLEVPHDSFHSKIIFDESPKSKAVCIKNPWGAVIIGDSKMYLCPKGLNLPDRALAEVILHEFVHSIGYQAGPESECQASEVSMSAVIASGRTPYGDGYTSSETCKNMTNAQRALAAELWPREEHPSFIKPGFKITFMPDIMNRIQASMKNSFVMKHGAGNILEIYAIENKGAIPRGPFVVKENLTNSQLVLIVQDADFNLYRLVVATKSQIPSPVSSLKGFGMSIRP